jgi:co-chaperonin GroES (HSP10)
MTTTLQAYGPFISLRIEEAPADGLVIHPDNVKRVSNRGRVLSVGEKVEGLAVGALVIFVGFAFETDGVLFIKGENVLGIVREEES